MKEKIKVCLATTALSLILLSLIALLYHAHFLCLTTIFEVLLANILIHIGLTLLEHFESPFFILEILAQLSCILFILIILGICFNWYSSTPLWVLILLGIAIYFIGCLIDVFKINNNLAFINKQLKLSNRTRLK